MRTNNDHSRNIRQRLTLTFAASGLILLLAGGLALYLMNQLGTAVERAVNDILPKTLVAMRLSEDSALLAASAPNLSNARNAQETDRLGENLDQLRDEINRNLSVLEQTSELDRLALVRHNVAILSEALLKLKIATVLRISLDAQQAHSLLQIQGVHSEFSDTVSPVVWGVSSLTRLFGKRAARTNIAELKLLRDQYVQNLIALLELQFAYRELINPLTFGSYSSDPPKWNSFTDALNLTLEIIGTPYYQEDLIFQKLVSIGENLRATWSTSQKESGYIRDPKFEDLLVQAIGRAQDNLSKQFSTALKQTQSSITDFVEQSVNDMGHALDIKAEGNLLFALLTAAADADSSENVSTLQDRFKRSRATFLASANEFLKSNLSLRNPILAGNVESIKNRLHVLGDGSDSIFDIRRKQLAVLTDLEQLLSTSRNVAAKLNQQVEQLVEEVQNQAAELAAQLERNRGVYRSLLVLVFLIGLLLLLIIAYFSVRTLGKRDRDIRQAAMVFESTGESIIITDRKAYIVAVNKAFLKSFEYFENEIVGRHIRILRSKHHHKSFYKEMLETLSLRGRWQGEIYVKKKSGAFHPEWLTINVVKDSKGNLSKYVLVFSDVAIVKRSLQQLEHLAHHDTLTGLPNRLLLQDRLSHAIHRAHREGGRLAILFLDIDRFKNINDTLGHTVGDKLLVLLSTRLSSLVRDGDTVARLGGDEFMILLEDYNAPGDAHAVAEKVLKSLEQAFSIQDQELFVTASIGISVYPDDGGTVDKLVRNSDSAMYQAKEKGKNNYQFYTTKLTAIAKANLRLESSLRLALQREEFVLHYQPKWSTKTGQITGVEALLRWLHPERGLIGPHEFLTTLEDCGLMIPVGSWILRTACLQARAWQEKGLPAIQMSVNLSGQQIVDGHLLKTVTDILEESRFDPRLLELELTEGFIMKQPGEVIELLNSLRTMGVSFAIDDFGTGHSSLSYLKQLPFQKLKIDRSFVRDIPDDTNDMAITSAIVALGHRLHMLIVAEGVETKEQFNFLVEEGCEEVQGYLFSKPLPESELSPLLKEGNYFSTQSLINTIA